MPATKSAFSARPTLAAATPSFIFGHQAEELEQLIYEKVRERAYLLFEQSGCEPGNEQANWLRAESEILRSGLDVRESGNWVALSGSIPDAFGQDMQIAVRPRHVVVRATESSDEQDSPEKAERDKREIFLVTTLTVEVDPPSATASFRDKQLNLMVKKCHPEKGMGGFDAATR
jgi:HSP20 family molecular chaperone IbpA